MGTKKKIEEVEETSKKVENIVEENKTEEQIKDEVKEIVEKAKDGNMTYAELATQLDNINPDQIDTVFDKFEEMGVDILQDDFDEEPDIDELQNDIEDYILVLKYKLMTDEVKFGFKWFFNLCLSVCLTLEKNVKLY